MRYNQLNLTGNKFNDLYVLCFDSIKSNRTHWKCVCNCGNSVIVEGSKLLNNNTKSCGCRRIKNNSKKLVDLTGRRVGFLTVINKEFSDCTKTLWKCECECGKFVLVNRNYLIKEKIKSCGCKTKELRKLSFLKNYGVEYLHQNKNIALKAAKSCNNVFLLRHWKTNEELICQAGWEPKVVEYLNNNKIDFEWQPKIFKMPNGKTYRPDLYLIEEDKWVEIKGYMRINSLRKWNWFSELFPNSELWDKKKLREMKIL